MHILPATLTKPYYMNDATDKALRKSFESEYYKYDFIYTYRTFNSFGKLTKYDFCILTDKSNDKKVIRFQKRWFGVTKKMKAEGKTKPKWVITNSFNLNSQKDFPAFFNILETFKNGKIDEIKQVIESIDFNAQLKQITSLNKDLKTITKRRRKTKAEKEELEKKQTKNDELSTQLRELNDENRQLKIQSFKSNLDSYHKIIKELKQELTTKSKNENHFQKTIDNS